VQSVMQVNARFAERYIIQNKNSGRKLADYWQIIRK
jgi:hypothetical protein